MKTIIYILMGLLFCININAQDMPTSPVTTETEVSTNEQEIAPENNLINCAIPGEAIEIQLVDVQLIESDINYSADEMTAIQQEINEEYSSEEIQFKLLNDTVIYVIFDGNCIDTFPVTEKNPNQVTAIIYDEDAGDSLSYQLKFTHQ